MGSDQTAPAVAIPSQAANKKIKSIACGSEELVLIFTDGTNLVFLDQGQNCCEKRYMECDDDLGAFRGTTFLGAEVRSGPSTTHGSYDEPTERQFLIVRTSAGEFTVANYNEHNGYYGGFDVRAFQREARS